MGLKLGSMDLGGAFGSEKASGTVAKSGTQTSRMIIDQAAIDKITSDVLGSDRGLAALASGENVAGLSGTSVKSMLAADLVSSIVGEISKLTATTITETDTREDTSQKKSSSGLKTVICTELERQGKLDTELYLAGTEHFLALSPTTVRGYRVWANKLVPVMQRSERLSNALVPIVQARYEHVTGRKRNLLGALTVYIGQPICYLIGLFVPQEAQYAHVDSN